MDVSQCRWRDKKNTIIMIIPDEFGKCVKCHRNLITERVINGVVKKVTIPDYDQIQYLLDDGSKMRVVMCKPCKLTLTEKDEKPIMDSVIAGWQKEVNGLIHWHKKKKDEYMKRYKKLKIKNRVKNYKYKGV